MPTDLTACPANRLEVCSTRERDERRAARTERQRLRSVELPKADSVEAPLVQDAASERLAEDQLAWRWWLQVDHRGQDGQAELDHETSRVLEAAASEIRTVVRLELDVTRVTLPLPAEDEHQVDRPPGGTELEDLRGENSRAGIARERQQVPWPGPKQHLERLVSVHGLGG